MTLSFSSLAASVSSELSAALSCRSVSLTSLSASDVEGFALALVEAEERAARRVEECEAALAVAAAFGGAEPSWLRDELWSARRALASFR